MHIQLAYYITLIKSTSTAMTKIKYDTSCGLTCSSVVCPGCLRTHMGVYICVTSLREFQILPKSFACVDIMLPVSE